MQDKHHHRTWRRKFGDAFRGLRDGVAGQNSFMVHIPCGAAVCMVGIAMLLSKLESFDITRFCVLLLCVAGVLTAELFNSAIEWLARAVTNEEDENIRRALDIASGGVLMASIFSVVVGAIVILPPIVELLGDYAFH